MNYIWAILLLLSASIATSIDDPLPITTLSASSFSSSVDATCNSKWTIPQRLEDWEQCISTGDAAIMIFQSLLDHKLRVPKCSASSVSWASHHNTELVASTISQSLPSLAHNHDVFNSAIASIEPPQWTGMTTEVTFYGNPTSQNPYFCCGECYIHWGNVKVLFWPEVDANLECLEHYGPHAHDFNLWLEEEEKLNFEAAEEARVIQVPKSLDNDRTNAAQKSSGVHTISSAPWDITRSYTNRSATRTAIASDGFVYTSPYIYYEVPAIEARDECGAVGSRYSTVRLSLLPEHVSSIVPLKDMDCFAVVLTDNGLLTSACSFATQKFDFAHIPCPPSSLRDFGSNKFIYNTASVYNPLIAAHPSLTRLDPAWSTCTPMFGWDPFVALTSMDSILTSSPHTDHKSSSAKPGPTPTTVFAPTAQPTIIGISQTSIPSRSRTKEHFSDHKISSQRRPQQSYVSSRRPEYEEHTTTRKFISHEPPDTPKSLPSLPTDHGSSNLIPKTIALDTMASSTLFEASTAMSTAIQGKASLISNRPDDAAISVTGLSNSGISSSASSMAQNYTSSYKTLSWSNSSISLATVAKNISKSTTLKSGHSTVVSSGDLDFGNEETSAVDRATHVELTSTTTAATIPLSGESRNATHTQQHSSATYRNVSGGEYRGQSSTEGVALATSDAPWLVQGNVNMLYLVGILGFTLYS